MVSLVQSVLGERPDQLDLVDYRALEEKREKQVRWVSPVNLEEMVLVGCQE